ncbi:MAG: beta-phosphoglucomutase [Lachnospiraceae bacterium]|jgi:beta-phosphoglucomutase|nr:beta-phosphoglucomutase [Lachnospiraceae bacterium]MCI8872032.1 beta-phosphoglucomutase [Lachnospiraceae bacterium]GFI31279.1 beta-phosphoglucomutase [Lachnospiraceae bacterium]
MIYQAVIFDLDGVICSTDQYHYLAWKEIADDEGIYFDEQINNRLRGVSRMESLEIILEKASRTYAEDEKSALAEKKNQIYRKLLERMTPAELSEDVAGTLKELKKRGVKIAIGSSSKNTPVILKQIGLSGSFDAVSDGNNITKSKPDPEVFLTAAGMLKEDAKSCLVVEDAQAGVAAAKAGGFDCAGIGEASEDAAITYSIRKISDLLEILK